DDPVVRGRRHARRDRRPNVPGRRDVDRRAGRGGRRHEDERQGRDERGEGDGTPRHPSNSTGGCEAVESPGHIPAAAPPRARRGCRPAYAGYHPAPMTAAEVAWTLYREGPGRHDEATELARGIAADADADPDEVARAGTL